MLCEGTGVQGATSFSLVDASNLTSAYSVPAMTERNNITEDGALSISSCDNLKSNTMVIGVILGAGA
jgi:hypothetical protein